MIKIKFRIVITSVEGGKRIGLEKQQSPSLPSPFTLFPPEYSVLFEIILLYYLYPSPHHWSVSYIRSKLFPVLFVVFIYSDIEHTVIPQ